MNDLLYILTELSDDEKRLIKAFFNEVDRVAQDNMIKTGKLEGSHYAAMKIVMDKLNI